MDYGYVHGDLFFFGPQNEETSSLNPHFKRQTLREIYSKAQNPKYVHYVYT